VYAQGEGAASEDEWIRHASGVLAPTDTTADKHRRGLRAVATDRCRGRGCQWVLPGAGESRLSYGPVFRGHSGGVRRGAELFAEVALPEGR